MSWEKKEVGLGREGILGDPALIYEDLREPELSTESWKALEEIEKSSPEKWGATG